MTDTNIRIGAAGGQNLPSECSLLASGGCPTKVTPEMLRVIDEASYQYCTAA
jgi:hypothetical protein